MYFSPISNQIIPLSTPYLIKILSNSIQHLLQLSSIHLILLLLQPSINLSIQLLQIIINHILIRRVHTLPQHRLQINQKLLRHIILPRLKNPREEIMHIKLQHMITYSPLLHILQQSMNRNIHKRFSMFRIFMEQDLINGGRVSIVEEDVAHVEAEPGGHGGGDAA